ncbi:MAG: anthranilate phosphoribosyltransferase [Porticoccaceae bacterium]|nr:MAG: anthranilate phosphoribosyltransferase [Porticoccaceae bacterium]
MDVRTALERLVARGDLSGEEMRRLMLAIMQGETTAAQTAGLLVALRMKGETAAEIAGAAAAMRQLATPVPVGDLPYLVDTCGTGGDGANLFNVSTAAAFVVAAAGGHVAKHGNRSVSSRTGSADLLEAAGVELDLTPEQVARCVREVGVGFLFAPAHHGAMRHAAGPRRELGIRTLFNLLGPLTNPAGVRRQVVGVFDGALCPLLAEVLGRLGCEHAWVVHGADGLDEITLAAETRVAEWRDGAVREFTLAPERFGIARQGVADLVVEGPAQSLALIRDALGKRQQSAGRKAADLIALNAGAAIYVAGLARTPEDGVAMAQDAIASGLAGEKLRELAVFTQCMKVL